MKLKGILFDFDGTIVDSEVSRYESLKHVLKDEGIDFTQEMWDGEYKSLGSIEVLNFLKKIYKKEWDSKKLYDKSHEIRLNIEKNEGVPIIKGFREFLDKVNQLGLKTIVCTGGKTSHFNYVCDISNIKIDGIGREYYENRKPAPDCFLEGLKRLDLKNEEVLVFDDAHTGLEAANNAQIKCVSINCCEDISDLNIWREVKDYTEINFESLIEEFKK